MDGRPSPFVARGGVALRRDLLAAGYGADEVRLLLRRGTWVRVRHGAYAEAAVWHALDLVGKHLLRCRAVLASLHPSAALSHVSAAVALGLPVWGISLDEVHVTRPDGHARHEAGIVHHRGALPAEQVLTLNGLRVTRADRTVLDVARLGGFEPGVVTADAALHAGLVTPQQLLDLSLAQQDWPEARVVSRVVDFADARSETVGESRTRVLLHTQGLPAPSLQVEIWGRGRLLGRVDFLLEEYRTVIEFDGRVKYRLPEGGDRRELEAVLWAEKRREDDIRGEGYEFSRVVWVDLDHPASTGERLRATMARGLLLARRLA